jgi:ketosteroid isomerase-like protein
MARADLETVKRLFGGWATGDFSVGATAFDPHVVLVVREDFPEPAVLVGLDGVNDYMRRFLAQFERTTFEAEELRVVGDTVLVHLLQRGTGAASKLEAEVRFFILFTFRGGKILRMESVLHASDAFAAAGLPDPVTD